jgi:cutinase
VPGIASAAPQERSPASAASQRPETPQQARANAQAASCPPLHFFGVRGSGETTSKQDAYGYGITVESVRQTVLSQVPEATAVAVNYPAIPVVYPSASHVSSFLTFISTQYRTSESTGVKNLTAAVSAFISACPSSYVVLAGYSQGARWSVIHM